MSEDSPQIEGRNPASFEGANNGADDIEWRS
jgi:hypothetical protein